MPFDLGLGELIVVGVVALLVIGPKDLPNMFRTVGRFTGRMRAMADDFRRTMESAADDMGYQDLKQDFDGFSEYARDASGLDDVHETMRDINRQTAMDVHERPDDLEAEAENSIGEVRSKSDQLRARTEAIKADAKAKALRVQAEQAEREAAQKLAAFEEGEANKADDAKPVAKKKSAKPAAKTSKKSTAKSPAKTADKTPNQSKASKGSKTAKKSSSADEPSSGKKST